MKKMIEVIGAIIEVMVNGKSVAMDMKQHKHLIFLICGTVIVTSGLAILPWFIV
ncbi:hypothetical protein [Bacillus bingmayongensis]|uniref:hypothetical protein n=1 Tax=Bacillus bingmayongensis TaxID=1150157 RepID=UPI001C8DF37B|nr:hypothetical protein [Bacillus bingmayongensis]MBY0599609.1 hypothetical protein [Bacillus bingmayongensis]